MAGGEELGRVPASFGEIFAGSTISLDLLLLGHSRRFARKHLLHRYDSIVVVGSAERSGGSWCKWRAA